MKYHPPRRGISFVITHLTLKRPAVMTFLMLFAVWGSFGQDTPLPLQLHSAPAPSITPPEVLSFSGSPLLLEISLEPPAGQPMQVVLESGGSFLSYQFPPYTEPQPLKITAAPFFVPGVHDLTITIRSGEQGQEAEQRFPLRIGFVDFVWGRDNFRFGNNAKYESRIGTYAEVLAGWLEERFGPVRDTELVLLTDYMYGLFGENTGRCYAFSGSELRYWRWPELLPSYYDSTYDIRSGAVYYQRQMHYLQLDIVYDYFWAGRAAEAPMDSMAAAPDAPDAPDAPERERVAGEDLKRPRIPRLGVLGAQSRDAALGEMRKIVREVSAGRPMVTGIIGPDLHHSMLVFGFIENRAAGTVDLLAANNWKTEQKANIRSLDAHILRVYLEEQPQRPIVEWRDADGPRKRAVDILFAVDVKKEYRHDKAYLDRLLNGRLEELRVAGRAILVVENAREAWIVDYEGREEGEEDEAVSGYRKRRSLREIDGIIFDRVNRNFRFEYPAGGEYWLEIEAEEEARILQFAPGSAPGEETAWVEAVPASGEGKTVVKRLHLAPSGLAWEEMAAAGQ